MSVSDSVELFKYSGMSFKYKEVNYYGLIENCFLDIYQTSKILSDDIVIDLGAGIGDFAIKASKKAKKVISIEPNHDDYELLKENLIENGCENVRALNIGVADKAGVETITFHQRTYSFRVDTLSSIMKNEGVDKIDILKMDIEGFETQVLKNELDLVKKCRVIAIELHGTKEKVDALLLPLGFKFKPITKRLVYLQLGKLLLSHPLLLYKTYKKIKRTNSKIGQNMLSGRGPDIVSANTNLVVGLYVK